MSAARRDLSFERAIEFASDLVRIPSLPGEEGDVARRIVDVLHLLGFDEALTDRGGNVTGRVRGTGDAPPVLAPAAALQPHDRDHSGASDARYPLACRA